MHLALLTFEIHIPSPESIKDKRRVVKSIKDKLHREHMVCVAEVRYLDSMHVAGMAVVLVNRERVFCQKVLDTIEAKLRALPDGRLGECQRELIAAENLPTAFTGEDGEPLWGEDEKRDESGGV